MATWKHLMLAATICSLGILSSGSFAQTDDAGDAQPAAEAAEETETIEAAEGEEGDEGPAEFTEAFLNDSAHLEVGRQLWEDTCRHCHGRSAYPGKAPKLKPAKYEPDFVFDRVTHGFRKMPAWKDVFSKEERMAITAYVMSDKFAP